MLIYSQDAFKDNFLVQWLPETLGMEHIAPSRPRVYLIDFEVAVHFQIRYMRDSHQSFHRLAQVEWMGRLRPGLLSSAFIWPPSIEPDLDALELAEV